MIFLKIKGNDLAKMDSSIVRIVTAHDKQCTESHDAWEAYQAALAAGHKPTEAAAGVKQMRDSLK